MQETGQRSGFRSREPNVHLNPVGVEEFFTDRNFLEASSWDDCRLIVESERLSDIIRTYSPNASGIPMPIAQMAVYVYQSFRLARAGRTKEHLEIGLDDLTEHGLKNALAFCGKAINLQPEVDNLGVLTRKAAERFNNRIFVDE